MRYIKSIWSFVIWIFERSDIIPPLIVVSTVHYAGALAGKDPRVVAYILGALIDIGHYRTVKLYLKSMKWPRFIVMLIFTAMTYYYHFRWYEDYFLAAGVPLLIIGLALLSKWEKWEQNQAADFTIGISKPSQDALQAPQNAGHLQAGEKRKVYICPQCGEEVTNLGNHTRWIHRKQEQNIEQ